MTVVFSNDFNSNPGSPFGFTAVSGSVSVTSGAAMCGTACGLNVAIADTTVDYGAKTGLANTSGKIRARLYFNPNSLTMANGNNFYIFNFYDTAYNVLVTCLFDYVSSGPTYRLKFYYKSDSGLQAGAVTNITNAAHCLEFYYLKSTGGSNTDGAFSAWIDGNAIDAVTGQIIYTNFPQFGNIRIGDVSAPPTGVSGNLYFDEIIVNDDGGAIGPYKYSLLTTAGTFTLTGNNAILLYGHKILTTAGAFALTGNNAIELWSHKVLTTAGTFTLAGNNAVELWSHQTRTTTGTFALTGNNAVELWAHKILTTASAFVFTGNNSIELWAHKILTTASAFVFTGNNSVELWAHKVYTTTGVFTLAGNNAVLTYSAYVTPAETAGGGGGGENWMQRLTRRQPAKIVQYSEDEEEYLLMVMYDELYPTA